MTDGETNSAANSEDAAPTQSDENASDVAPTTETTKAVRSTAEVIVAVLAMIAIVAHDLVHIRAGNWFHTFWVCDVSAALIAPAILLRSGLLATTAFTWLLPGTIIWAVDGLVNGTTIMPTSWGIHVGGLIFSAFAVRRFGVPRGAWKGPLALVVSVVLISRLFLPAEANVNAAYATPAGWNFLGGTRLAFATVAVAVIALIVIGGTALARKVAGVTPPRSRSLDPAQNLASSCNTPTHARAA